MNALCHGFHFIIVTLIKFGTIHIANAFLFWRTKFLMVDVSLCTAGPTPTRTLNKDILGGSDVRDGVHLCTEFSEHLLERVSLCRGARKSVEDHAGFTVRTLDPVANHTDGHVVWDQIAFIYKRFDEFAEFRLIFKVLAKEVSRRDMYEFGFLSQNLGLRTFTYAGRAKQDDKDRHQISLSDEQGIFITM